MSASLYVSLLFAILTAVTILVLLRGQHQVQVAVAARPLVSGEAVREGDLRYTDVPGSLASGMLRPADVAKLGSRQAVRNIPEGGLLTGADLVEIGVAPQMRAMSIPIETTRAAGGSLGRSDTVDVIDSSSGVAIYVVVGARVLSVGDTSGSKLGSSSTHYAITVAVDDAGALRLAAAITAGKVDVVRSTGAAPATVGTPPTTVKR